MSKLRLLSGDEIPQSPDPEPIPTVTLGSIIEIAQGMRLSPDTRIMIAGGLYLSRILIPTHLSSVRNPFYFALRPNQGYFDSMDLGWLISAVELLPNAGSLDMPLYLERGGKHYEVRSMHVKAASITLRVDW